MESQALHVTQFVEEDLDGATELFVRAFAGEPWNETWPRERARRRLSDLLHSPGFFGVAAHQGNSMVGFALGRIEAYLEADHFGLFEMCVTPQVQRQGVGSRILEHLHTCLIAKGCTQVYLLTARESSAEHFYMRNGYAPARRVGVLVNRLP